MLPGHVSGWLGKAPHGPDTQSAWGLLLLTVGAAEASFSSLCDADGCGG